MRDERLYLGHIREAIADIRTYAEAGEGAFWADRMRQDAIIRKLEVIGEAVKQLSDETRRRQPAIPWRQIAGMRDHLTHAYFGVDLGLVWRVIERDLQPLDVAVAALLHTSSGQVAPRSTGGSRRLPREQRSRPRKSPGTKRRRPPRHGPRQLLDALASGQWRAMRDGNAGTYSNDGNVDSVSNRIYVT